MFGGQGSERKNDVKVLDMSSMKWLSLNVTGNLPEERFGHTAVAYKSMILVFGGAGDFNSKLRIRMVFARIHALNTGQGQTANGVWETIKPEGSPPDNRRFHNAAVVGCNLLIFGGMAADSLVLGDLSAINLGA